MNVSQRKVIGAIVIAGALIVAASVGIWAIFLNNDAPAPVSLQEAIASIGTPTAESDTGAATAAETDASGAGADSSESGTTTNWTVAAGSETFVGYRIGEELATIGTTVTVGRTSSVTGTITISGPTVESAMIEANLQELTSNDSRRDRTLQNRGLETASYPTATFALSQPIDLGGELTDGAIYSVVAIGDLTLHGTTQAVEIPMEAQYIAGTLVIVGSLEIELADYGITAPTTRIALAVDDHGTMELQLVLERAG